MDLKPTSKLAFGDGDLMAYDYMWDKKSIQTNQNFKGQFNLKMEDKTLSMNLWMKGAENREIFSALSPRSTALGDGIISKELESLPIPTMVVRQDGEAWDRPFVAVYEPSLNGESAIEKVDYFGNGESVGIQVKAKNGQEDFIFSNTQSQVSFEHNSMKVQGTYAVISKEKQQLKSLFLADGTAIESDGYAIKSAAKTTFGFTFIEGQWAYMAKDAVMLESPLTAKIQKLKIASANGEKEVTGKVKKVNQQKVLVFELPKSDAYTTLALIMNK